MIHWGVPEDVEMYIQQSGRVGQDGLPSYGLLVYSSKDLNKDYTSEQPIEYCKNEECVCRRKLKTLINTQGIIDVNVVAFAK